MNYSFRSGFEKRAGRGTATAAGLVPGAGALLSGVAAEKGRELPTAKHTLRGQILGALGGGALGAGTGALLKGRRGAAIGSTIGAALGLVGGGAHGAYTGHGKNKYKKGPWIGEGKE